jgi:hypothetical protein
MEAGPEPAIELISMAGSATHGCHGAYFAVPS